jgi:CheY-specific phosphatase CheX
MMNTDKPFHDFELVMQSMITKTQDYFETEHETGMAHVALDAVGVDSPALLDMTVIVGLGGMINLLAVFSFQTSLVNAVYAWMTVGFHDRPDEVERHRQAAIGELVNTILGHCTLDFGHLDSQGISLTPPVILDPDNVFPEMNHAVFSRHCLNSMYGRLNISLVGFPEVFPIKT